RRGRPDRYRARLRLDRSFSFDVRSSAVLHPLALGRRGGVRSPWRDAAHRAFPPTRRAVARSSARRDAGAAPPVSSKGGAMQKWLPAALDYIPRWIEFQMRQTETPGCVVAVTAKGDMALEQAFGVADLGTGTALTALHRFRVASHSKSFTAAAIMQLREAGRLELDDPAGRFVDGLHPTVAEVTPAQLLSHSAGLIRDGTDAGQLQDRRTFLSEDELRATLAAALTLPQIRRLELSNYSMRLD